MPVTANFVQEVVGEGLNAAMRSMAEATNRRCLAVEEATARHDEAIQELRREILNLQGSVPDSQEIEQSKRMVESINNSEQQRRE